MKKTYIKWLSFSFLIIGMIVLIIILNYQNSKKSHFLNYPVNYSLCNTNTFDVKIYANRHDLSFFDIDSVASVFIEDEEFNHYQVKMEKVIIGNKVLIDKTNYYSYNLKLTIPIKSDEIIKISKAVLKIINKRGEQVSFNIGNISMVSGEYFTLLETKSIVGMTKFIENYSTLDKVKMELYNFQLYDVYLKEIKLVSSVVETISKNTKISTGKTIDLEIPLIYLENTFIDNVGVILVLEYQGSIYEQIINPYVLFKTSTIHTKPLVQVYEVY